MTASTITKLERTELSSCTMFTGNLNAIRRFCFASGFELKPRFKLLSYNCGVSSFDTTRVVGYEAVDDKGEHRATIIKTPPFYLQPGQESFDLVICRRDITLSEADLAQLLA